MVSWVLAIFFNLFARALPGNRKAKARKGAMESYRVSATDLCEKIVKAAGRDSNLPSSLEAIRALADLEKKRHQLLVLVAAVERVAPSLKQFVENAEQKKWYQKLFHQDQRQELDLLKDIRVLLDVLRRIKTPEE